ncbi:MAG: cytochrome c oxidase subunit 3 [Campylobacteraceae bacterium]|nr:cytochrome c oxidase subunit 3 [Campylobacteraceae bacterium]
MDNKTNSPEIIYDKEGNAHEVVDFRDDYEGAKLGFWFFLFTELMLFGAMFLVFTFFFYRFTEDFVLASSSLNILLGGLNTFILLLSTYFMGMSLIDLKNDEVQKAKIKIYITIFLSLAFLLVKYFEWMAEIHHGIYPDSALLNSKAHGEILFFGLYFTMTGLHGIHILVGIVLMLWVLSSISKEKTTGKNSIFLENIALYWDLVHLVWVFLFPLFYIIGRG